MTTGCRLGGKSHDAQAQIPAYIWLRDPFHCHGTRERERPIIDTIVYSHETPPRYPSAPCVVQLLLRGSARSASGLLLTERRLS